MGKSKAIAGVARHTTRSHLTSTFARSIGGILGQQKGHGAEDVGNSQANCLSYWDRPRKFKHKSKVILTPLFRLLMLKFQSQF
jgi:hypothetical protein